MKYFFEKFSEVESPQSGSTLDNTRLVCANVDKLIVVLKLFFVYPSRWVQRVKTKHRFRFDSYSAYYISLHSLIGKTWTDMRVRLSL